MAHDSAHPLDPEPHDAQHHGVGHVVSPKILITTALGLLFLTVITVLAAKLDFERFDLRELNIFVALAIAVVKGSLVCLYFMHLRWDRPFNAFVLVAALAFVGLFIWFAMTDTGEYQFEVVEGDAPLVQQRVADLPPPIMSPPGVPAGH